MTTLKVESDTATEASIAEFAAQWSRCNFMRIGDARPGRDDSRIDGLFYRGDQVVAFCEIKSRSCAFRAFPDCRFEPDKIDALRTLQRIVKLPVVLFVEFACGTLAYIDFRAVPLRPIVENWRRLNRDGYETGPAVVFPWSDFRIIRGSKT